MERIVFSGLRFDGTSTPETEIDSDDQHVLIGECSEIKEDLRMHQHS